MNSLYDGQLVYTALWIRRWQIPHPVNLPQLLTPFSLIPPAPLMPRRHLVYMSVCTFARLSVIAPTPRLKALSISHLVESGKMDPLFSGNYFSAKLLFCLFSVMLEVGQCFF